jgi:hypothetical protein
MPATLKRARAGAHPVDRLQDDLFKLKSLRKILEEFGIDPAGPDAKRLAAYMMSGLYHGIQRIPKTPHQPAANLGKWTPVDDMRLMLDVEWCQTNHDVSDREAISLTAEAFPAETHRFPYRANGRKSPKSTPKERYEEALWQRWIKVVKPAKAKRKWMGAFGVGQSQK